eukprot:m.224464 g.224464  ORF g.224464 m.224464 type:complete len:519 (-) comp11095_c0_seq1:1309-2865(-)
MAAPNTARYDRQLRLWGDHGQADLEQAKICLINGSASGTETLKNLVLPGVGSFTIVDGTKVTERDLGNNFFVDASSLGQSRAMRTTQLLCELNEHVRGDFVEETVETLLETNPQFFVGFSVVVASQLPTDTCERLARVLYGHVPLVTVRAYGVVGHLRIIAEELYVHEAHPDNFLPDLRALQPFPELQAFVDSIDMSVMTPTQHSHVPYLVIIIKLLGKWAQEHGHAPKTRAEKEQFKAMVRAASHVSDDGSLEENFEEAINALNTALVTPELSESVVSIFADERAQTTHETSSQFWIVARALREFHAAHGVLPLSGALPDMTADSDTYARLHGVFAAKARADLQEVLSRVQALSPSATGVPEALVKLLCKNAAWLQVMRPGPLTPPAGETLRATVESALENPDSNLTWEVVLRAADRFYSSRRHLPGEFDKELEDDVMELKSETSSLLAALGVQGPVPEEHIQELCRFGAAELHNISAFIGGIAAQEIIKLVTHQYVPVNNTVIFNGAKGTLESFQL